MVGKFSSVFFFFDLTTSATTIPTTMNFKVFVSLALALVAAFSGADATEVTTGKAGMGGVTPSGK